MWTLVNFNFDLWLEKFIEGIPRTVDRLIVFFPETHLPQLAETEKSASIPETGASEVPVDSG